MESPCGLPHSSTVPLHFHPDPEWRCKLACHSLLVFPSNADAAQLPHVQPDEMKGSATKAYLQLFKHANSLLVLPLQLRLCMSQTPRSVLCLREPVACQETHEHLHHLTTGCS